ncbi:hypothetical protein A3C17_01885 [Candidatus Uhrbacteria bacterium RIFCSPHIGHO2_02_FULL_53_13]|uniref:Uncharacterized protein n=2 Tax=Candidatus Uhriibacteriota TaxID=1752732 RepID=A0A1F7U0U2_9BACT|nr:MAG: hypothetical protein A3C17_01885 [Candidatus Uhrbacteria bacterium RIFCSPHIGHO2_02_FULL_53_13]OGL89948.1 MAG: hypothetical protein A3I45_01750 [Candidatus Uhrbacteria bacterium RIFCSPLOWO2_02_FULL_53_10]
MMEMSVNDYLIVCGLVLVAVSLISYALLRSADRSFRAADATLKEAKAVIGDARKKLQEAHELHLWAIFIGTETQPGMWLEWPPPVVDLSTVTPQTNDPEVIQAFETMNDEIRAASIVAALWRNKIAPESWNIQNETPEVKAKISAWAVRHMELFCNERFKPLASITSTSAAN